MSRTTPLTRWGDERGLPVDRWYIEAYLHSHADVVRGRVLEVKSDLYASRLGAAHVEVVDIDATNPHAQIVGDLCDQSTLASERYDAVILTQTLQLVGSPVDALENVLRSLKPGGSLLATVPCLSRVVGPSDRWRWSPHGFEQDVRRAVSKLDSPSAEGTEVEVRGLGNGLAGRAFLFGLATEDLPIASLEAEDPDLPVVVAARVRR